MSELTVATLTLTADEVQALRNVLGLANSAAPGYLTKRIEREGLSLMDLGETVRAWGRSLAAVQAMLDDADAEIRRDARVEKVATEISAGGCDRPPRGWRCTREKGHGGPCAALPVEPAAVDASKPEHVREPCAEPGSIAREGADSVRDERGEDDVEPE